MFRRWYPYLAATAGLLALLALPLLATAADHAEAPGTRADPAADIADLYVWQEGDKLVAALTFAGGPVEGVPTADQSGTYDEDVVYVFHIDNDGDNVSDIRVQTRFGRDGAGDWGVQVRNLPGISGAVSGPVETTIDAGNGLRIFAGLRDDPFFFDLEGFQATLASGDLAFDSARDSFAGLNVSAIVVEMDLDEATDGTGSANIWATTARK